jgi:perosamine synthetase
VFPDRIPVAGPWVTELEIRYASESAANDWYGKAAQSVGKFERAFAERIGVKHASAVPHCTAALHLALLALDIGPGDEVIVPDITWVATAAPIIYVGATPIFADIDPDTWCLTADTIERCISPRTKAILTVDLYGGVPDMDEVRALADRHGLPIIEDAAEAIGASWKGEPTGGLGRVGAFSFHGSKTLTTGGEGGMFVTDDDDIHARVLSLRDHGRSPGTHRTFITTEVGQKYRMSSLQAAFGLAQLERLDELIERKRQIFGWYADRLGSASGLTLNYELPGSVNTYWMVTAVIDASYGITSLDLMADLDAVGVESRPFFHPLSALPAFAGCSDAAAARERNVVSHDISPRAINLPSALMLDEGDVDRACSALTVILDAAAQRA